MASTRDLSGARVLITGASAGLGRAAALQLSQGGATVLACARRGDRLQALASVSPNIEPHVLDISDPAAVDAFCNQIGGINAAVLNAGITELGPFADSSAERDAQLIATNVAAQVRLARGLQEPLTGGRLVFVGSLGGMIPLPYQAVYSGTKAFVHHFALALAEEWAGQVSVGLFAPGGIKTEMTQGEAFAELEKHLADVDNVAQELVRFVGSDGRMFVPGAANRATARAARLLPVGWGVKLAERIYRRG